MFTTPARYALVLAFALGAMHFNGASARAEKCNTAIPEYSGESSSSLSPGAPVAVGTMRDRMLTMGGTSVVRFSVARYFTDPDGDDLTYSPSVSPAGKVQASITDSTLTLTAVSKGTATVTVTATDPSSADATQVFDATIANSVVEAIGTIADTTVAVGASLVFNVSPYFRDPDPEDRPALALPGRFAESGLGKRKGIRQHLDDYRFVGGQSPDRCTCIRNPDYRNTATILLCDGRRGHYSRSRDHRSGINRLGRGEHLGGGGE